MNFKIEKENKDVMVILEDNEKELAKAKCYFEDTPKVSGKNIGCIGELEMEDEESGIQILKKCEEILKEQNVQFIVAPMNRNTWNKYRVLKYTNGDSAFLLENVNPIEHNAILKNAGFKEIHTYSSTKGLIEDSYKSEILDIAKEEIRVYVDKLIEN